MLTNTIVAPDAISNSYDNHNPPMIESSEKMMATARVFLNDFPTFIAAATGIIIKLDTSNTPTVAMLNTTTTAKMTVEAIWNRLVLIPSSFAYVSSKLRITISLN